VLLLVRTERHYDERIAREVIRQHGGIFPPSYALPDRSRHAETYRSTISERESKEGVL
jgi:hypothetical protein